MDGHAEYINIHERPITSIHPTSFVTSPDAKNSFCEGVFFEVLMAFVGLFPLVIV